MTKIYEIGPFQLDAEAGVLTKAGVPVTLGSRAVAVCKLGARAQDRNLAASHLHRLDRGVFAKVSRCALDDRFEANRDLVTAVCLWPGTA